jgi:hypothetical protein
MNLMNLVRAVAQSDLETSRLMGKVIAGVVILIVVLLIFKAVKGKKK